MIRTFLEITLYYIIILIAGILSYQYIECENIMLRFLIADCVMTVVTFIFSIIKKNSSVYDAYWSVIPFYFVLAFIYLYPNLEIGHWLVFIVISVWSWRLTLSWARGWRGFGHEDFRYVDLAKKTNSFYPIVNFLGIHLFPTLIVFAAFIPLFYLFENEAANYYLLAIGLIISSLGIYFEYIADLELARFRNRVNPKTEDLLDSGIWGRSRNPNYLGEMLFWAGMSFCGFAFGAPWITGLGAIAIILMFLFISIPMKNKRMATRRNGFEAYKKRVPLLFPRLLK